MKPSILIEKTTQSRLGTVDFSAIKFGKICADHFFSADFQNGKWENLQISPYKNLSLSPATSALHYGQSIFEGMKAYRNEHHDAFIFRPYDHLQRFNRSAKRMCMPEIPADVFIQGLTELIRIDQSWIPTKPGDSLYIRPFMFGTDEFLGARPSENYKFIIFTSPANPYYLQPMNIKIETQYARAMEGGTGFTKCAGNYGAAFYPTALAMQEGYHQILWTDSHEHLYVEEAGTMNIIFVIDDILITPALSETILQGITRDSILTLAKEWKLPSEERKVKISEVIKAITENRLQEAFGVGTAATIAPIGMIGYKNEKYTIPVGNISSFSQKILVALENIRRGKEQDKFNWLIKI